MATPSPPASSLDSFLLLLVLVLALNSSALMWLRLVPADLTPAPASRKDLATNLHTSSIHLQLHDRGIVLAGVVGVLILAGGVGSAAIFLSM